MKSAIIIGCTSGMGMEVAILMHQQGWKLGLMGRREDKLRELKEKLGDFTEYCPLDVTDPDAPQVLRAFIDKIGGVDLIFHCAGIGWQNHDLKPEWELATVQTNAFGFTNVVTTAYNYFAEKGKGHIAVISSIGGTKGLGAAPAYSATKRFQNSYIQSLAQHAHIFHHKIVFTDIRPGFVDTALLKADKYPLTMKPQYVAKQIVKAIDKQKRVAIIDWRYRIVVAFWHLVPNRLWENCFNWLKC